MFRVIPHLRISKLLLRSYKNTARNNDDCSLKIISENSIDALVLKNEKPHFALPFRWCHLAYEFFFHTTVELQWLEHLWNHELMFETGVFRADVC